MEGIKSNRKERRGDMKTNLDLFIAYVHNNDNDRLRKVIKELKEADHTFIPDAPLKAAIAKAEIDLRNYRAMKRRVLSRLKEVVNNG